MCGLFGAIVPANRVASPVILRALAYANRSRGNQSLGFFSCIAKKPSPMVAKFAEDPQNAIMSKQAKSVVANSRAWAICGHTRFGTRGAVSEANCHPFTYENVTLAHNGVVTAPATYAVDSMLLADLLARTDPGEATKAIGEVAGNFALTWFDSRVNRLYMLAHRNPLAIVKGIDGVWYYSSESAPLSIIVGKKARAFTEGQFLSFAAGADAPDMHDDFKSSAPNGVTWYSSYDWDGDDCFTGGRGRRQSYHWQDKSYTWDSKKNAYVPKDTLNVNGVEIPAEAFRGDNYQKYLPKSVQDELGEKTLSGAVRMLQVDFLEYKRRLTKYLETNDSGYLWCGVPSSEIDQKALSAIVNPARDA